jgi:hypothetical protein
VKIALGSYKPVPGVCSKSQGGTLIKILGLQIILIWILTKNYPDEKRYYSIIDV